MKSVHLICNAHLDPVWLWEWEEGAAEAVSTFRVAADICESSEMLVFNHNEAILYEWVETYEPELFRRIQALVKAGKWHIMGGWYLQPDCNMPCGESFVRQILLGRRYFRRMFGARPTTAVNVDPFGHTRGLVQILKKSGYDSYLCCRPGPNDCPLPAGPAQWEGYDGSRVLLERVPSGYNSPLGRARAKVESILPTCSDDTEAVILWGVGNHGGGPSRRDVADLSRLIHEMPEEIRHSTPEAFFSAVVRRGGELPVWRGDLNPWGVGCYTSQVRLKQKHRLLENQLFMTEKMVCAAWCAGLMKYPAKALDVSSRDLATVQFHDVLPGSSIQPVEDASLRLMDSALERLSRTRAHAFFALASGQPKAGAGRIPILVYNPHPFPIRRLVECEFQLADQNRGNTFTQVSVFSGRQRLPSQVARELSNIPLDWRKRVVFQADLAPGRMNRFDCVLEQAPTRPAIRLKPRNGRIRFRTPNMTVDISMRTGLIDRYVVGRRSLLGAGACRSIVMHDNSDPWGMRVKAFRRRAGRFTLLSQARSTRFAGVDGNLAPVRVIEDGPARTVVEALFGYSDSYLCQRYILPKHGTEIELEIRVFWNEKDRMLKLSIPTSCRDGILVGQVAFGRDRLPDSGAETVAQKWIAVVSEKENCALTCVNEGSYGLDFKHGELRLSLLRSSAYSAHPVGDRVTVPQDRFSPRMDQGERLFRFWLNGGDRARRMAAVDGEALARNENPMVLSFFPSGRGRRPRTLVAMDNKRIRIVAVKKAERGNALVIRLFEPIGRQCVATLSLPFAGMRRKVRFSPFEVKTIRADIKRRAWVETDLMEQALPKGRSRAGSGE